MGCPRNPRGPRSLLASWQGPGWSWGLAGHPGLTLRGQKPTELQGPYRPHFSLSPHPHYLGRAEMAGQVECLAEGLPLHSRLPRCCSSQRGSGPGYGDAAPGCVCEQYLLMGTGSQPHTPCTAPVHCLLGCSPPGIPAPMTLAAWVPHSFRHLLPAGWA